MPLVGTLAEVLVLSSCAAAVVTNVLLIYDCELLELQERRAFGDSYGTLGLFKFNPPEDGKGECINIGRDAFEELGVDDNAYKTARVCSVIGGTFGAILFVTIFFQQCLIPLPCSQRILDLSSTMVQISLALVYVIWMSKACDFYRCSYGNGATLLILTQIFWLAAGCLARCMRRGRWERRDEIKAVKEKKREEQKQRDLEQELERKQEEIDELQRKQDEMDRFDQVRQEQTFDREGASFTPQGDGRRPSI